MHMSVFGRMVLGLSALAAFGAAAFLPNVSVDVSLSDGISSFVGSDGQEHAYWLQLPDMEPGKLYPLILHFHGSGGGTPPNIANIQTEPFARFRELARERGYILAAPAYGAASWMNASGRRIARDFLRLLSDGLPVDPARVYSTGVSMGGGGALTFAMFYPQRIAAVFDVFGVTDFARFYGEGRYQQSLQNAFGGTPAEVPEIYREQSALLNVDKLVDMPVIIIHGDADNVVPIWSSRELAAALKAAGGTVEYIEVPGEVHRNEIVQGHEKEILDFLDRHPKPDSD